MKKILSALLLFSMLVCVLCITVFAVSDADFVGENEFVIATYNGVNTFVTDENKMNKFEDSAYWIIDNKDLYNIKYVSFVGQIANPCEHTYSSVVSKGGGTRDDLINLSLDDEAWNLQYKRFTSVAKIFTEEGMPSGVSLSLNDYISSGFNRANLAEEYLPVEDIMPEDATFEYLNENNYVTFVENNGQKYMIFQLELWTRTTVLDWFKEVMNSNPDKYAIIITTSFVDPAGAMYTMWDWDVGFKNEGTSRVGSKNMAWDGQARDGEGLWDYAFSKYDNILAIISNNSTSREIMMNKFENENGIEVVSIDVNADAQQHKLYGPTILLTKISPDNKEISCAWAVSMDGIIKNSVKTVKLSKLGTLAEPLVDDSLPQIPFQYNGANSAYIFGYEGNTFRPNANMTRAEACTIFSRLLLGTQTIPDGYTTRFEDVKSGDWFYNAIAYLDETGFFFRNKNTTYKPNEPITRAEFVELANSASALIGNKEISFTDVPEDHFYYNSIVAAAASGLVNGYEDNTFRPDNTITRAEVVTVINRLLGLKATEKTISLENLENVFVDIGTHWGKLNILMASNSNVHGDYYYEASLDGVKETSNAFVFANNHFSFEISKKNGKVSNITNLTTGKDVTDNLSAPQFIYLTNQKGNKVSPTKLEKDGNRIKVSFKDGTVVYMLVDIQDNYMTFEIDSELPKSHTYVTFANLRIKDDGYLLNGIGMSAWTNPVNPGYRDDANSTLAHAYSIYASGTMGAKLGVVFADKGSSIKHLQELMDAIDPSVGIVSKAGGAYARECESNYGDYAIFTNTNPETLGENIQLALEIGIDQFDIHQGKNTFRQGDFVFAHTESGTVKEYYEKIGKKFDDAGIDTGLHTYAYYIDYNAANITANPKWQKQLELMDDTYTLRKKMSKTSRNVATVEDATSFDNTQTFFLKNSPYILIDEEIILVKQGTTSGFINVTRGTCGTTATQHSAGAKIYHLSGCFEMFSPVLGSELYYHIADLTAKTYNEGGFDFIYIDAIDGLFRHINEDEESWYYYNMFIQRISSQCKNNPNIELSSTSPQEWNVRGRKGAWDTANRSIKKFINNHIASNKSFMANNYTTTLGWFAFFPDESPVANMKNTTQKTLFHDDLDVLGMGGLLYDMSIVFNPFSVDRIRNNPFHYANAKYYADLYGKLRKSHYFSDEVIEQVKTIGGEWKVIEKNKGEYAFLQMYYAQANLGNARDVVLNTYSSNNPFGEQTPFIRIESRYSTMFEKPITVAEFDETKTLGEQTLKKSVPHLNMTPNMSMSLKVRGTGKDGDAMLITMVGDVTSGESGGEAAYFIDLNFEGWREVIILDLDSAEYDTEKYKFTGITTTGSAYATYRKVANYKSINSLSILLCGETAKNAQISSITAYEHTNAPVKNPTITVGSSSMTFNCIMTGGEYLEYDPLTGKATLYHNAEQTTEEITFSGKLTVQKGGFTAKYTATAETAAPVRARITLGFAGQEITN